MLEAGGVKYYGGATVDGYTRLAKTSTLSLPSNAGFGYSNMPSFRHIAVAFDVVDDSMRFYADGILADTHLFEPGAVAKLDCTNTDKTYVALGHRQPMSSGYQGEIADLRMYVGQALSATEVHSLAYAAGSLRACRSAQEGEDSSSFRDAQNRGCEWCVFTGTRHMIHNDGM